MICRLQAHTASAAMRVPLSVTVLYFALAVAPHTLAAQFLSAQTSSPQTIASLTLPEAPSAVLAAQQASAPQANTATISGTVVDFSKGAIPGAVVVLTGRGGVILHTLEAGAHGDFAFTRLVPGAYRVEVTAPGMGTYVSAEVDLTPGKEVELSEVALAVGSTSADVQVIATQEQIAEEEVKEQEKQRAFGILPNFYSSYIWNAAPLTKRQKYRLALHSITDPVTILAVAGVAGIEQAADVYPGYHQGATGYFKRLGAGYASTVSARMFDSAILPSLFHQDPRYFWKGRGTIRARAWYALSSAVVTRGDNGRSQPNYSYLLGGFITGALAQSYHPARDRGVNLFLRNGVYAVVGHALNDLVREFVLRAVTKVPDYKSGEPEPAPAPSRQSARQPARHELAPSPPYPLPS